MNPFISSPLSQGKCLSSGVQGPGPAYTELRFRPSHGDSWVQSSASCQVVSIIWTTLFPQFPGPYGNFAAGTVPDQTRWNRPLLPMFALHAGPLSHKGPAARPFRSHPFPAATVGRLDARLRKRATPKARRSRCFRGRAGTHDRLRQVSGLVGATANPSLPGAPSAGGDRGRTDGTVWHEVAQDRAAGVPVCAARYCARMRHALATPMPVCAAIFSAQRSSLGSHRLPAGGSTSLAFAGAVGLRPLNAPSALAWAMPSRTEMIAPSARYRTRAGIDRSSFDRCCCRATYPPCRGSASLAQARRAR